MRIERQLRCLTKATMKTDYTSGPLAVLFVCCIAAILLMAASNFPFVKFKSRFSVKTEAAFPVEWKYRSHAKKTPRTRMCQNGERVQEVHWSSNGEDALGTTNLLTDTKETHSTCVGAHAKQPRPKSQRQIYNQHTARNCSGGIFKTNKP